MSRFWSCDDAEGLRTPLISWGIWGFQVSSCFRQGWWSSYLSPTTKESVWLIAWIQKQVPFSKHPSLPHIDLEWNPHHPSSTLVNPSLWSIYPRTGYPKITSTRYDATSSFRITLDPLDLPVICISCIYQSNLVFQLAPARDRVMYYILYLLHGRVVLLAVTTVGHDTLLYRVLPPLSVYINIF